MSSWQPFETAPKAKHGETWGPLFLLGREGRAESNALGRYQAHLLDGGYTLEITTPPGVFPHEHVPFTHWMPLPDCPTKAERS